MKNKILGKFLKINEKCTKIINKINEKIISFEFRVYMKYTGNNFVFVLIHSKAAKNSKFLNEDSRSHS